MIMLKIQWYMVYHFNAEWLPSPDHLQNMYLCMYMGLPWWISGKESAFNVGDLVQFLGWEDPLENGKATHCSILAWRIPWTV